MINLKLYILEIQQKELLVILGMYINNLVHRQNHTRFFDEIFESGDFVNSHKQTSSIDRFIELITLPN